MTRNWYSYNLKFIKLNTTSLRHFLQEITHIPDGFLYKISYAQPIINFFKKFVHETIVFGCDNDDKDCVVISSIISDE